MLWVAYRLYCRDVEAACDQAVIRTFDREDTARYAETLLHLGRGPPSPPLLPWPLGRRMPSTASGGCSPTKSPPFGWCWRQPRLAWWPLSFSCSDRNPTEPQLAGEAVTGGQVVQVLELDAPWTASPTATTTVPLPEEMVAEAAALLADSAQEPFSPAALPDPLPDWTAILTTTQATYYACFMNDSAPAL